MLKFELNIILDFLKQKGYQAEFQHETHQISCILAIEGFNFPLFIKIHESPILQLILFLPAKLTKESLLEVSRLLHFFNKEIDLPGFGMDEISGTIFYRCSLLSTNQIIDSQILEIHLKSMESIASSLTPLIMKVAEGALTFESILKNQ